MKILITGSTGLIGKNLVNYLSQTNHDLLTPSHNELNLLHRDAIYNYLKFEKPDCIIHLAAKVGGIAAHTKYPLQFLLENLDISRNVIITSYECGIKKFINMTSACIYPAEISDQPLTEDMAITGSFEKNYEGYSVAKAASALMCKYISENNTDFFYNTLIPCSIYGPHCSFNDENSTVIASAIKKIYTAKINRLNEVTIWGDGTARREFIYAGDLAKIIKFVTENLETIPPFLNVGTGTDYSVNECYEMIAKVLNYKCTFVHDLTKPVGKNRRLLSVNLMKSFGLKTETSLFEGIKETVNFYKTQILKVS